MAFTSKICLLQKQHFDKSIDFLIISYTTSNFNIRLVYQNLFTFSLKLKPNVLISKAICMLYLYPYINKFSVCKGNWRCGFCAIYVIVVHNLLAFSVFSASKHNALCSVNIYIEIPIVSDMLLQPETLICVEGAKIIKDFAIKKAFWQNCLTINVIGFFDMIVSEIFQGIKLDSILRSLANFQCLYRIVAKQCSCYAFYQKLFIYFFV